MEDKTLAATTTRVIGTSLIASVVGLCCIGPWAVVLFGVSGAVAMPRWLPYRPYVLAVALAMLAWGFWRFYRPQSICKNGTCPSRSLVWLKSLLWPALALVVLDIFVAELQWILVDPRLEGLRQ